MRKKSTQVKAVLMLAILFAASGSKIFGQQLTAKTAMELIRKNAAAIGLSKSDLQNSRVPDAHIDKASGTSLVYLQQTFKGVDVFNSIQTVAFKNDQLISLSGGRISKIEEMVNSKDGKASLSAAAAVRDAATHLKLSAPSFLTAAKQKSVNEFEFSDLGISSVNIKSKLIWLNDAKIKTAVLTWQVEVQPNGAPDYWLVNVDATKGGVISKLNLNVSCNWDHPQNLSATSTENNSMQNNSCDDGPETEMAINSAKYKVVPYPAESPAHPGGAPSLQTNPWELAGAGNNATTLKWNDNGTVSFDSTRGNNVLAQEDVNGNNGSGKGGKSTTPVPDLTFNYTPNFNQEPTVQVNQQFALTNLFYWNNIIHDLSYQYGFDEASGNFQANNLSRGGAGNDYVFADGQDGSGSNNANFSTPPDGSSPRMQMFLFSGVPSLIVNKPVIISGRKTSTESGFSTNNKLKDKGPINGRVILYADQAADTSHRACSPPFNAGELNGRIALIDRGDCNFTVKVKNAQNAGAIAAIVVDNVPGEYPIIMGGTDNTITIPAVMVSFETGDTMKRVLDRNVALTVSMTGGVSIDGDLDNGIITHEYTHGISNRLTGGANNVSCLQNAEQMGEGWSDYMALMATTDWRIAAVTDGPKARPIGTYALGQARNGPGIRLNPYSTDIAKDPWTYADMISTGGQVHAIGEIWCSMVWEMTWNIIQQAGIGKNLYLGKANKGNNIALRLVIMGMKLQPCSPGFVDGRNAILRADTILYGGTFSAAIWKAFAKRGLGVFASQGSSFSYTDGVADFTEPTFTSIAKGDFNALRQNNASLLQWQNLTNTNASKFVIERSNDGTNFREIGSVNNNDAQGTAHSFIDHFPSNGANYYRLRQTAVSGSAVYSAVRMVSFNSVNISPNPAKDKVTITVGGNNKPLKVYLVTATGKQLSSYNMNGEYLNANLPRIASGMYYIQIKGEEISETRKLIIE